MLSDGAFDPASIPGTFGDAMPVEAAHELSAIMADSRPSATRAMARALAEADLRDMLATVSVPTLLLNGEADGRSTPAVARALTAGIPTSRLVMLPGLGHESFVESPDVFNAQVRMFLHSIA
jgi:pimeloyl-ACP methyl ester carboxylesterase